MNGPTPTIDATLWLAADCWALNWRATPRGEAIKDEVRDLDLEPPGDTTLEAVLTHEDGARIILPLETGAFTDRVNP